MKNIIPVILAADNNYAMPMSVTMTSIMANANDSTFIDFALLVPSEFSKRFVEKINSIRERFPNCNIKFIDMKDNFQYTRIEYFTYPTFYRLMAAEILPQYEKCLYLDPDTIVCSDLNELFSINISANYIAGVKAPGYHFAENGMVELCKAIGLPDIAQYINTGVMIMNLVQIRKNNIVNQFLGISKEKIWMHDSDIINLVCYNHIQHLPFKYNVITIRVNEQDSKLVKVFSQEDINQARSNPYIVHYASNVKPWHDLNSTMSEYWWKYSPLSPFYFEALSQIASRICENQTPDNKLNSLNKELQQSQKELRDIRNSFSFIIGMAITYIPRKIIAFFRCWRKNGLRYALRAFEEEIKRILPILMRRNGPSN